MHKTYELNPIKLSVGAKLTKELVSNLNFEVGLDQYDFIKDIFSGRLEATLIEMASESQNITFYQKPQNFWDCIFRRPQKFTLMVTRKEIMKNPPKFPGKSTMLYTEKIA